MKTTLCSRILHGPSGEGVEPAEAHKRGGKSWSERKSGGAEELRAREERGISQPEHLILLERSSQGACLAGVILVLLTTTTESSSDASPRRNRKGHPPVSGFGSPLA